MDTTSVHASDMPITYASCSDKRVASILEYVFRHPICARIDISRSCGLTPSAMTTITTSLLTDGILHETGEEFRDFSGAGRNKRLLTLNKQFAYAIGVEFNIKHVRAMLCNAYGEIISKAGIPHDSYKTEEINAIVCNLILRMYKDYKAHVGNNTPQPLCCAIAVPGHMDSANDRIITNNPLWKSFSLTHIKHLVAAKLAQQDVYPSLLDPQSITAENNIECMSFAQYLFRPTTTPSAFMFFHVGPGIYCSFFDAITLGHPKPAYIGEIGHMVVNTKGPRCDCGKKGCLQTYISETCLIQQARFLYEHGEKGRLTSLVKSAEEIDIATMRDAYLLEDPFFVDKLEEGIQYLAIAVANAMILHAAEKIFINSKLFCNEEFACMLKARIQAQLTFVSGCDEPDITIVDYDTYRGAHGACAYGIYQTFLKRQ